MNENLIGLDIGTGSVKVATSQGVFQFPSIIAEGKNMELEESKEIVLVGDEAVKQESIQSMILKTPVYRGAPTSMKYYVELIGHALDKVLHNSQKNNKNALNKGPEKYSDLVIVAGIPYSAKSQSQKIKNAVIEKFAPKFFGLMFQAKATLDNEGIEDGIICHVGNGTSEIMAISNGNIAHPQTVLHGVGDIAKAITSSKTGYLNYKIFSKNTTELVEQRRILAAHISDALEKVVIDYPQLPVIFAGGGVLIPKLISDIKNDIITNIRIAKDPVFSNALVMLKKAAKCA